MEYYGKNKKPYRGIWIAFVTMFLVPVAFFALFYFAIMSKITVNNQYAFYISLSFSGLVGFIYGVICILSGLISDLFSAMVTRVRETLTYFGLFSKDGFKYYIHEFINDGGPIMWGFLLLMGSFAVISIIGFANFFQIFNAAR